jgi:hypothetical protein
VAKISEDLKMQFSLNMLPCALQIDLRREELPVRLQKSKGQTSGPIISIIWHNISSKSTGS